MSDAYANVTIEGYEPDEFAGGGPVAVPYNDLLGLEWDLISPDRVVAHLDVRPEHLQPYGIVHGGVHASLTEAVASMAGAARAWQDRKQAVGVQNTTSFLRPVREGRLTVAATPIHVGRTQHLWLVEIVREDGKLAARGELRMQVVEGM